MKTEFMIFRVKNGKEDRAEEWMRLITARRPECVATLQREAMYYESIFKVWFENRLFLAWYSVQGDLHGDVNESEHEIDKLHCEFWGECIESDWKPINMKHVVSFAPESIDREIDGLDRTIQGSLQAKQRGNPPSM